MRLFAVGVTTTALALCAGITFAADEPAQSAPATPAAATQRYTFSWPFNATNPAPRGGSSRGPQVTPATGESPAWRALHEAGLAPLERDRRAILAIAGEYRATFDFLEVATYAPAAPAAPRDRPYQSWGTEKIFVDQDRGTFISLVHILELRTLKEDGSVSEPIVQRHWREDWRYEPTQLIEFKGSRAWQRRELSAQERRGQWSQTVFQVDDSPRYAATGHWDHTPDFSTWISGDTWRPLPRRESQRKDYQVLLGTNRVTLTAGGWLQEENNLKTVVPTGQGTSLRHLAREYGVARYDRLQDADFAAATVYFQRTQAFWDKVHAAWLGLYQRNRQVALSQPADPESGPHARLFDYADQLAAGQAGGQDESQLIDAALRDVGAPVQAHVGSPPPAVAAAAPKASPAH